MPSTTAVAITISAGPVFGNSDGVGITLYSEMEEWYANFLQTAKAKECIEVFDSVLPDYQWMSSIKKIDSILWSIR